MPRQSTYHLGRVVKLGAITQQSLVHAITHPDKVLLGEFAYTFTDIHLSDRGTVPRFVFARLSKFTPEGQIQVVEPDRHIATSAGVLNLLVASSPFVYIPEFSGIAYQHVWNRLPHELFTRAFADLVEAGHERLFAQTIIEPIADLRTFVQQISTLTSVAAIEATVHPPNPLFGIAWDSLRKYLKNRRAGELRIREQAADQEGIATELPAIAEMTMAAAVTDSDAARREKLQSANHNIADAAVLMAADGYGKARVEGRKGERRIVIRTQQSQITFAFEREPDPEELYEEAHRVLARISTERYLEHP